MTPLPMATMAARVQFARDRARHRRRQQRRDVGDLRRVERDGEPVARRHPPHPLHATARNPARRRSRHRERCPARRVPFALPDSATPARRLVGARATFALGAPARAQRAARLDACRRARPRGTAAKRDGSRRRIVACTVNAFGSLSAMPRRAVERSGRGARAKPRDVDALVGDDCRERERHVAVADVAFERLALRQSRRR